MEGNKIKNRLLGTGCALLLASSFIFAIDDGVQRTPAMGWNSWNQLNCNGLNQTAVLAQAVTMAKRTLPTADWLGRKLTMKDAGFRYINLDDCWEGSTNTSFNSSIFPDPVKMCDSIRRLGLIPGLYTSAGTNTCAGRPAQHGADVACAKAYADWGFQYLKEDWCNVPTTEMNEAGATTLYQKSYNALRTAAENAAKNGRFKGRGFSDSTSTRYFVLSLCEWGDYSVWNWGAKCGHSARSSGDIASNWTQMLKILDNAASLKITEHNVTGFYCDQDMLEVGVNTGAGSLTSVENQTHYDIWAQMQSPLIAGNDLSTMSDEILKIYLNTEVNAVNQDSLAWSGRRVKQSNNIDVWYKRCFSRDPSNRSVITDSTKMKKSVILFNRNGSDGSYVIQRTDPIELGAVSYQVRNLWTHANVCTLSATATSLPSFAIKSHGTTHLLFTPMALLVQTSVDEQLKRLSKEKLAAQIVERFSSNGFEIYSPGNGKIMLFDVQGKQIASFIANNGAKWYKVPLTHADGTVIMKAVYQDRIISKSFVISR